MQNDSFNVAKSDRTRDAIFPLTWLLSDKARYWREGDMYIIEMDHRRIYLPLGLTKEELERQ